MRASVGGEDLGEELLLEVEAAGERDVEAAVDGPLGQPLGGDGAAPRGPTALSRARSSTSSWGTTSSTRPMASASSARTWRPVKMRSLARAGPTRRARRWVPTAAGDDAEEDLGLTELRLLAGDAEVAGEGQLAPAAEREAGDRRDRGAGDVGDGVEGPQEVLADQLGLGPGDDLLGSSAERNSEISAPAAKIRSPPVTTTAPGGAARSDSAAPLELPQQLGRQRVHLGVVEADDGDAVVRGARRAREGLSDMAGTLAVDLPNLQPERSPRSVRQQLLGRRPRVEGPATRPGRPGGRGDRPPTRPLAHGAARQRSR